MDNIKKLTNKNKPEKKTNDLVSRTMMDTYSNLMIRTGGLAGHVELGNEGDKKTLFNVCQLKKQLDIAPRISVFEK
jgi:hypothetical protein